MEDVGGDGMDCLKGKVEGRKWRWRNMGLEKREYGEGGQGYGNENMKLWDMGLWKE